MPKKLKTRETVAVQASTGKRTTFDEGNDIDSAFDELLSKGGAQQRLRKEMSGDEEHSGDGNDHEDDEDAPEAVGIALGRQEEMTAEMERKRWGIHPSSDWLVSVPS